MRIQCYPLLAALALPVGVAAAQGDGDVVGLAVGTRAEPVVLEDLDGNPHDLAAVIGSKPVLLQFWATWCENCEALRPEMEAAFAEYGDRVAFFAVAVAVAQSKRSIRRHLERHPVPYPVVWDTRGRATRAFDAPTTSYVVMLDGTGTVRHTGVGPRQDIRGALKALLEN
ncbi:MAG TPA: TlpA disulfide reductase family protein [Gemmatimonadales bacterium]